MASHYFLKTGMPIKLNDQEGVIMKLALQTCQTLEDFKNFLKGPVY